MGGVTKGEPENTAVVEEEAEYQVGVVPATQVADKVAVLLLQILPGPVIFVGIEMKGLCIIETVLVILLTTAISGLPSPSKSPIHTKRGPVPDDIPVNVK